MIQLGPLIERHALRIRDVRFETRGVLGEHALELFANIRGRGLQLIEPGKLRARIELARGQLREIQECRLGREDAPLAEECIDAMVEAVLLRAGMTVAQFLQSLVQISIERRIVRRRCSNRLLDQPAQRARNAGARRDGLQRIVIHLGGRALLSLRFQQRRLLQQGEQVARLHGEHALDDAHLFFGEAELAQRSSQIHQQPRVRAIARHRALQQFPRTVHVAAAKLAQGGLVEDGRMLGIDGFDAQEQRVRTRAISACQRALCLRNQLADLARLRTLIESPVPDLRRV